MPSALWCSKCIIDCEEMCSATLFDVWSLLWACKTLSWRHNTSYSFISCILIRSPLPLYSFFSETLLHPNTPTYVWKFLVVSKTPAAINIGWHPQRVLKAIEERSGSFMWHLVSVQRKGKVWESMQGYWWWQSRYARLSMLHEAGFKCSGLSVWLLKRNGLLNGPLFDVKRQLPL